MARVVVTDHALVRWLERVHGVPMEQFREQLCDLVDDAAATGCAGYVKDGFTYSIVNGTLLTVVPKRSVKSTRTQFRKMGLIDADD